MIIHSSGILLTEAQLQTNGGRTTLVVSKNPNGDGYRVVDPNTNNQLINTSNQAQNYNNDDNDEDDDEMEQQVVNGLLDWLDKKKKKKRKDKDKIRPPRPTLQPYIRPERHEKKVIHIHINNHIKKSGKHAQKKHHGGHYYGQYENYHDGHYDHDYHDKHYHGKHSWPLLSHHFNWDYYSMDHYGGHQGDHYGDDYGGYESKKVAKYVANNHKNNGIKKQKQASPSNTAAIVKKSSL